MRSLLRLLGLPSKPPVLPREPVSRNFGIDRGTTIGRYYIEAFLELHRKFLKGTVLEIGGDQYATAYSASGTKIEILDPDPSAAGATIIADLVTGVGVPENRYDAAIVTQVLHVLPNMQAAVGHLRRSIKPGGVILATLPCISQVSRFDMDRWGDFWRVTDRGARQVFESHFLADEIQTFVYGNHLAAIASLTGYSAKEIGKPELDALDPDFQVLIGVTARKSRAVA